VGNCAVIGSSFIGLEVAASLRQRGLQVAVIGPEPVPLAKILGDEVGLFIQKLHEERGVRFFLNTTPRSILEDRVELDSGQSIGARLVILGVGVSPRTSLAKEAGIKVDNGVIVDETLRADAPDVFAAGDVARYPVLVSGELGRIEHWVVAERQGQAVAHSILGIGGAFRETPFFWSQHYDVTISYAGHAPSWDDCKIKGDLGKRNACIIYRRKGKVLAVATIGRDKASLRIEAAMDRGDSDAIEAIINEQ
jgi:NADPH-dependent 2,4-dienoyl-CoA reductase/sulfur reductase-like enzyme